MSIPSYRPGHRRSFLSAVLVMALGGIGSACGVKGPLYLPEEAEETEEEKKKDEEKTSRRDSANPASTLS